MHKEIVLLLLLKITILNCYTFQSAIDNLLYIKNTSTLFAISSSHLHQLYWSTTNQTLLLLHRRVQLHSSIDNTENGVSVFVYDPLKQLLLICARSVIGRCILYDANDISRTYLLDSTIETNYLGCLEGCYTFLSSDIIRSALNGNRLDRNGNIINSQIKLGKDLLSYNLRYQLESSDNALITSLTFLPERSLNQYNSGYLYGFDYQQYTYYVLKSSRIGRLCQSAVAMRVTYEEIPLLNCQTNDNSTNVTGAFHTFDKMNNLYIVYDHLVCIYSINEILRAFQASKLQCQAGIGYRLAKIVDSVEVRPTCEKTLEQNFTDANQCTWQPYRTNTYVDGTVGAVGELLYQTLNNNETKIRFLFAQDDIVIISTSERRVLKFIRTNQTKLYLLHEAIYHNEPFNSQYVIDYEHESLIFAVHSELHRYAYNSCSLYDTCRSCIGSRRYDRKSCIWFDGKCSLSANPSILDRGCPPSIEQVKPMNINVNTERVSLKISGAFEGVQKRSVKVIVKFPLLNQNQFLCPIETVENDSLTCSLIIPKQPVEGVISIDIKPDHPLSRGDTDVSGSMELTEKLNVYIPKPILTPAFGPAAGGTKIRIQNVPFDENLDLLSATKVFLGEQQCRITEITTEEIECINQACHNDSEQLELRIQVNDQTWQIEKTYFQCRSDPFIFDWHPKRSILSGGFQLLVTGKNLDVVQNPLMKFVYNVSDFQAVSSCEPTSSTQMICVSPGMDRRFDWDLPIDLDVAFLMDNIKIIPEDSILTVVADPVYYPFEDYIQEVNSTKIIKFEGFNLASTHSIDIIAVQIDQMKNACIPFNLTETSLSCLLPKSTLSNLKDSEGNVEIQIGTNLTFVIGKILYQNRTRSYLSSVPYLTKQLSSWTITILIILTSITFLSLLFLLAIFIRRRYFHPPEKYQNKPPQYYKDVWCELGKKWQIHPKHITIAEKIGQGCFGDVYRGEFHRNEKEAIEVAVKVLRDQNVASMHEFLFEANRMKDFAHPNVLSLVGVAWDPIRKAMVLLPYMKNGDLRSYISNEKNRPTVRQLITWGIEVADGMEYLSSLKFIHRDLATRNCMLDENLVCRISDFGLSRDIIDRDYYLVPRTTTKEKDGQAIEIPPRRLPIRWLSPESIESSKYTIQSDVWSFGILLWELLSRGKTPYPGIDNADIFSYVKNGYRLPQPTYCPPLLYKSAMLVCWQADPSQRPSFTQLAHDIRHILHQLEVDQQQQKQYALHQQPSSSADDDDTTIVERYSVDRKIKRLSTTSMSSSDSIGGQYITTPHRQSENIQLLFDRDGDDEDAYAVAVESSVDLFSTTRLLPKYTETSIAEDA